MTCSTSEGVAGHLDEEVQVASAGRDVAAAEVGAVTDVALDVFGTSVKRCCRPCGNGG